MPLLSRALLRTLFSGLVLGHAHAATLSLEVGPPIVRRGLPSGSGLAHCENSLFGVSDATGLLYTLTPDFRVTKTHRLRPKRKDGGWIGRKIDPDFESATCLKIGDDDWLLVLGSGYRPGTSDSGHLILARNPKRNHHRSMAPLFASLNATLSPAAGLNVEGLAVAGNSVFLFQRGSHFFRLALPELLAYLRGERDQIETIERFDAILPEIDGIRSAFSGAEYWPEARALIFTASVEAKAPDAPKGKRLASALGLIDLDALRVDAPLDLRPRTAVLEADARTLHTKAESLILSASNACRIHGTLVSDNDDGKSVFRAFTLTQHAPATGRATCPENRENERPPRP